MEESLTHTVTLRTLSGTLYVYDVPSDATGTTLITLIESDPSFQLPPDGFYRLLITWKGQEIREEDVLHNGALYDLIVNRR